MLRSFDDASGDRSAVESACRRLHERFVRRLLAQAISRGCDGMEAHDVVQEVFLRLFKARVLIAVAAMSVEAQSAHLFQTLRWVISSYRRRQFAARRISPLNTTSLEMLSGAEDEMKEYSTPVTLLERKWRTELVEQCLQELRAELKPEIWQRLENSLWDTHLEIQPLSGAERVALLRGRRRLRDLITTRLADEPSKVREILLSLPITS